LPELPKDDPARTTEFPPEEIPVLPLEPPNPDVNEEPDELSEE